MAEVTETTNAISVLPSPIAQSSITECPICKRICKDPRSLPCIHTFCYKCIEALPGNETSARNIACPVCRQEFPLPDGGISGLPPNFFVKRLSEMEARARLEEAENGKLCEACVTGAQAESVEIKRAELYCIECKMRLCQSCQSNHSNANPTHTCVRIKNDLSPAAGETVVKLTDLTCDKHVGEKMRLFCNDCREVICLACMVDVHQQHSWTDVNKVDKELRQLMTEEDTENLTRHAEGCQESVNRMEGMRSEVNDVVADIESAVRKQAEQLKSLIEAERETLLQKLYTGHRWRLGKIESAMDELQLHISLVEFLRRYADELYRRGMDIDVAQQNQSVRRNAAQLLQFDPEGALDSLNKFRITYNPSSTVEEWSEVNALGDLEILMNEDDQTTNRSSVDLNAGETLDNALKCQHCFHFYSDPRVLPCFHTFCRQCIDVDETGDTITCPLCRKEFPSAEDGIDRLPLNVFVDKLMDVIKMISYANKLNICGLCGSKSESEAVDVKFADKYCIECKQLLCNSCWEGHRNSEATQEHRFCEVRDKSESVGRMMALLEPWCQDHDKKSFEFYCYDCCSVLCRTCLNEKHKTHKCNEIEKVENEFSQDISSYVEKLDRDIDKCSEDVSKLGSIEERLNDEISKVEEEILERAAMMTSVVDEDEEKLLQEIKTSNKARTKKMDDVIRKLSHKAMLAELMKKYIEELKTKGTAVDVAREVGSLQKATDFILKSDSGRQLNDAEHVNTTFTAANLLKYSSHAMENAVGKVELEWTRKETSPAQKSTPIDGLTQKLQVLDITRCPICEDVYTDPRLLACHHSFCLKCIARRGINHTKNTSMQCPLCKQENPMPASGVGSLPKNIFVLKLIQKTETANNGYSQPLCDECSSNSEDDHDSVGINFAVEYCTDCKLKLCKGCKHIHRRSQVNRSHTFVKLVTNGEHSSEDIALALQDGCSNHGGDKLKLYCHACKTVICMTCFDEDHVTHPCSEVRAVEKELRRQMTNDINSLSVELETCRQLIAQVERNKKTLTDKVFDVQNEVRQEAERLKSAIEQDKETLLRQISSGCRRLEEISDELGRLKEHISVAEWSRSYADVLINYGAGVDIARHWQAMKMALDELSKFSISTSYSDFDSMKVTYTPSKVINRDSIKNVVGEINGKMTVKHIAPAAQQSSDAKPKTPGKDTPRESTKTTVKSGATRIAPTPAPKLTRIVADGLAIRGLAVLGNSLAVIRWPSEQQVEIYDAATLERKPRIVIRGISDDIFGFASCSTNSCYYLSDWQNSVIHRIRATAGGDSIDRGRAVGRWSVNRSPTGLSVNNTHNVLLTYWKSNIVDEFTTSGTLVRFISLQSDIVNPWQAIQVHSSDNNRSKFVVSHGDSDDPQCRICVVDFDGRILKNFGDQPGSGSNQLNVPMCIAVTTRDQMILVADQRNDRVLLLQSSLKGAACDLLASVNCEIRGPSAMYLDESCGRLFVGCWDGKLLLFDNVIDNGARKI